MSRLCFLPHIYIRGGMNKENLCRVGYVSCDQDRVRVGFIQRGLEKILNVFSFVQGKMLCCS